MSPPVSPWTALLQSLHSALIDEVTERHPEPKPELGLPKKFVSFQFPSHNAAKLFWVRTSFPENSNGVVLIAYEEGFLKILGLSASAFWALLLKRATTEFSRRQIQPQFAVQPEFANGAKTPGEMASLLKIVWIPITLPEGSCWFGIGV